MRRLIAGLLVMLWAGTLQATTVYDAATDLTETSIDNGENPNGVWSYGYRNTVESTEFTPLPVYGQCPIYLPGLTGLKGWFTTASIPTVMKNTTDHPLIGGSLDEIIFPPGELMLHPGATVNDVYAVLRWTAPSSTNVDLAVTFTGIDYYEGTYRTGGETYFTTTDVHVVKNGLSLFDADVTGGLPSSTNVQSYLEHNLAVVTGDTIDFIVGPGDNGCGFDSTGLNVQISVPEPSSVALLIISAISLFGYARRRQSA